MKKVMSLVVVVVMAVVMQSAGVQAWGETKEIPSESALNRASMNGPSIQRLYQDKLKGYNRQARPTRDHTQPTVVTLGLTLKNIHLDDEKQEFSVNAWAIMAWKDDFLEWVPAEYTNIEQLHFDDDDIWIPDIKIYNSADGSEAHPFGAVPVLASYKGQVHWFPPTRLLVKCDLSLLEWPRDQHECVVRMGSWAHHGEQIDIQILTHSKTYGVMTDTLEENSRWSLVNTSATRTVTTMEGHDPYVEVSFAFRVKREGRTQALYITQSTLAVVVVVLSSYFLPLHSFLSRLIMHLFSLGILIVCFLTLFVLLPASGGPAPLVVRYYSGTIVLTSLSLLSTIFLTTRACCCCCRSSSSSSSSSYFSKTLSPYNTLEDELAMEADEEERHRTPTMAASENNLYTELREAGGEGGKVGRVTRQQLLRVINFLMLLLFGIAFIVDYIVLRNVTL